MGSNYLFPHEKPFHTHSTMYLILVTEDGRGSGETWMGFENIFPIQRVSFFARNCFTRKMEKREEEKQNLFYRLQVSGMRRGPTARAGKAIRRGGHAHKRKRDGSHHRAKVENFARTKKLKRVSMKHSQHMASFLVCLSNDQLAHSETRRRDREWMRRRQSKGRQHCWLHTQKKEREWRHDAKITMTWIY